MVEEKVLLKNCWASKLEKQSEANLGVMKEKGQFLQMYPFRVSIIKILRVQCLDQKIE